MPGMMGDVGLLLQVVLAFLIGFVVIPGVVLPRPAAARSRLDVVAINFVRWLAVVVVLSHVFAASNVYGATTLALVFLAIAWFGRYRTAVGTGRSLRDRVRFRRAGSAEGRGGDGSGRRTIALVALTLPLLALTVVVFWLRVQDVLGHLTLSLRDAYVHLSWAGAIQSNTLWPDGVYPMGLASVVAYVDLLSPFTDIVHVARFMGPIDGTLLVLAIYYAVVRLTRNPGAALFAAGTIGVFGASPQWHLPWDRQVGLLPQEFAVVVTVLALPIAILAVTERGLGTGRDWRERLLADGHGITLFAGALAAAMIHPVPAVFIVPLVAVGAGTAALARREGTLGHAVAAVGTTAAGAGLGLALVPFAQALGFPAYEEWTTGRVLGGVEDGSSLMDLAAAFLAPVGHTNLSLLAAACVLLGVVATATLMLMRRDRVLTAQLLGLTAAAAVLVVLYGSDLEAVGTYLDEVVALRVGHLVGAMLAIAFGVGLGWLGAVLERRRLVAGLTGLVAVGVAALAVFGVQFPAAADGGGQGDPPREQLMYEQAAEVLVALKARQRPGSYTVVGTTTERQMLAGHGQFIEAWVFARDIGTVPAGDVVPVPTADAFVFVEKVPLDLPDLEVLGPNEEFYQRRDRRGRLMTAIHEWAQDYDAPDSTLEIHYEDAELVVYHLQRDPAVEVDPDAPQFKDYEWRRGELFTEGPTEPPMPGG